MPSRCNSLTQNQTQRGLRTALFMFSQRFLLLLSRVGMTEISRAAIFIDAR
jgi:hypothetical protein